MEQSTVESAHGRYRCDNAVAYLMMTLVFGVDPAVARPFSLAIQSVGMTAAPAHPG